MWNEFGSVGRHWQIGPGKARRLSRLLAPTEPTVWLALDESLVGGPNGGLRYLDTLLSAELLAGVDAVVAYRGLSMRHARVLNHVAVIENVSGNTTRVAPVRKVICAAVDGACTRGADGVAYQLNLSDTSESESLNQLGLVSERAEQLGMPLLVMAYYRRTSQDGEPDPYDELRVADPAAFAAGTAHAVRVAAELGADVIKTQYTTRETFDLVVAAADGVPVLIAGGTESSERESLVLAESAVASGATGICFGRRIFNSPNPPKTVEHIRRALNIGRK